MKGSITKKLVMTYSAVLGVFLTITALLLNITAWNSFENTLIKNLFTESAVIEELYYERVSLQGSAVNGENEIERYKHLIKSWFSGIKKLEEVGFASNIALVIKNEDGRLGVFTPGETVNEANFKLINPEDLFENLKAEPNFFRIMGGETSYFAVSRPMTENDTASGLKAWITAYTPINELNRLITDMNLKALFAVGVALLISAILSYFLSLKISKPVKLLKNHAERIASRDFKSRVTIRTGDEIESLGHAMNKIAGDLSDYDMAQRRFLQNVSHELKTPVMAIMGYAEGLRDGVIENNEKALNIIMSECERLQRLVGEVLYLSKLETVEEFYSFKNERLNEVLEDIRGRVRSLVEKSGLTLCFKPHRDCFVAMDRDKFIQAVLNLVSNAIRYAESRISIETEVEGKTVEITVRDDGGGMDEQELSRVFERFYKGKKGSTGLGMAITKAILEKHGGMISAFNHPEGGAVFKMVLPLAEVETIPN